MLDEIAAIASRPQYGKGRQNLALLLGEFGRDAYGIVLGDLMHDAEVYGHSIKALSGAKIPGHAETVRAILETEDRTWIRKAAHTYVERHA